MAFKSGVKIFLGQVVRRMETGMAGKRDSPRALRAVDRCQSQKRPISGFWFPQAPA